MDMVVKWYPNLFIPVNGQQVIFGYPDQGKKNTQDEQKIQMRWIFTCNR